MEGFWIQGLGTWVGRKLDINMRCIYNRSGVQTCLRSIANMILRFGFVGQG